MKKTILYIFLWIILADFANYTDSKSLLAISCILGFFMIIYIVKKYSKNE